MLTLAEKVNFTDFLDRDINAGFSGGEIKRSELLQLMAQNPDLVLFDEPESGVDMENMQLVGKVARQILDGALSSSATDCLRPLKDFKKTSGLIITHTGYILDYVNADRARVLFNGHLCCQGRPRDILDHIHEHGYQECIRCIKNRSRITFFSLSKPSGYPVKLCFNLKMT